MKNYIVILVVLLLGFQRSSATEFIAISSPNKEHKIEVALSDKIYYQVSSGGELLMYYSPLSMQIRGKATLGYTPVLIKKQERTVHDTIETVWGNRKIVVDNYTELSLGFENNYRVIFRAYNDGVAYRFTTNFKENIIVENEEVMYRFLEDFNVWFVEYGTMNDSYEGMPVRKSISQLEESKYSYTPVLVESTAEKKMVLCEADVRDYPGMFLQHKNQNSRFELNGIFPDYPLEFTDGGYSQFDEYVTRSANYIANTDGSRSFPWRAMVIAHEDKEILNSDLVYKLAAPLAIKNTEWIKPGKVSWEWWNDWNLENVNFETGINTETYKYYIDFASENKLDYVLLDEGWSDPFNMLLLKPGIDMPELLKYAEEKNIKLILWGLWKTLNHQMDEVLPLFQEWGVAGIKIDFIDRDDQLVNASLEHIAREAAKHNLFVDFHGCAKPTGLSRTYPNVLNYEGVRGGEYNKFSSEPPSPDYNCVIPFTRMTAGPMDYTPGAMRNFVKGEFTPAYSNPGSKGTRCHQLGMYVVYAAPLQMLCDAPTQYEKYPDILGFLSEIPVTWDETIPIDAQISEFVVIARQKGNNWFIGGINNWTKRTTHLSFEFLADGNYSCRIIKDGLNAHRIATDYMLEQKVIDRTSTLDIDMAEGGGFIMCIEPTDD